MVSSTKGNNGKTKAKAKGTGKGRRRNLRFDDTLPTLTLVEQEVWYTKMYADYFGGNDNRTYPTERWTHEGDLQLANWLGDWPVLPCSKQEKEAALAAGIKDESYRVTDFRKVTSFVGFTVVPKLGAVLGIEEKTKAHKQYDGGTVLIAPFSPNQNKETTVSGRRDRRLTDAFGQIEKRLVFDTWNAKHILRRASHLIPTDLLAEFLETTPVDNHTEMEYHYDQMVTDYYWDMGYVQEVTFEEIHWEKEDWIHCANWLGDWPKQDTADEKVMTLVTANGIKKLKDENYAGFRILPGIGAVLGLNKVFTEKKGVSITSW